MRAPSKHHAAIMIGLCRAMGCLILLAAPKAGASGIASDRALVQCKADAHLAQPAQRTISSQFLDAPLARGSKRQSDLQGSAEAITGRFENAADHILNVSYFNGKLAIEAQGARLTDILMAFQHAVGLQVSGPSDSDELVFADRCGAADEVLRALMDGSDLQYILIQSTTPPGMMKEILISRRVEAPSPPVSAVHASWVDNPAYRKIIDKVGDRPLRSLADSSIGLVAPSGISAASSATAGGAEPVDPTQVLTLVPTPAVPEAAPASGQKQVTPAGAYMQELYRLRQQLPENSGPLPH